MLGDRKPPTYLLTYFLRQTVQNSVLRCKTEFENGGRLPCSVLFLSLSYFIRLAKIVRYLNP